MLALLVTLGVALAVIPAPPPALRNEIQTWRSQVMSKPACADLETIMEKIRLQHRQLTLPAEIIEQARLHHGDLLEVSYVNGAIILSRPKLAVTPKRAIMEYAGIGNGVWGKTTEEIDANLAEDRASWEK